MGIVTLWHDSIFFFIYLSPRVKRLSRGVVSKSTHVRNADLFFTVVLDRPVFKLIKPLGKYHMRELNVGLHNIILSRQQERIKNKLPILRSFLN